MKNYKITNTTNLSGKRESRHNATLSVDYVDARTKKTLKIKPGETVFLKIQSLPPDVHLLRLKKLINVVEVSDKELRDSMNIAKPVIPSQTFTINVDTEDEEKTKETAKRKIKKLREGEVLTNE